MTRSSFKREYLLITGDELTLEDVFSVAFHEREVSLPDDSGFIAKIKNSVDLVESVFKYDQVVYGINTNFGGLAYHAVSEDQAVTLQHNLLWGLHCGLGKPLDTHYVRAAMLIRANALAKGVSSVRIEILERFTLFLNQSVTPRVRSLGSIGASGDLVPLSYIASAIVGLHDSFEVEHNEQIVGCVAALKALGLKPLQLRPKEGLALVNGTSVLSGIASIVTYEFKAALELTLWINALMCQALLASSEPFDSFLHLMKPHWGQQKVAELMSTLLAKRGTSHSYKKGPGDGLVQDRYSIRCIPQYFGPLVEGIQKTIDQIEVEVNSADDNPLADLTNGRFVQGGNFYGQYVGLAMDQLRQFIGLAAKQLDVQISMLVAPEFNAGLPASLSVGNNEVLFGLKGLQIVGNSILPRLLHLSNPVVQLFPTHAEQFNQNINSQGFNAAMLAHESMTLYRQYLSAALVFAIQSVELRASEQGYGYDAREFLSPATQALYLACHEVLGSMPNKKRPLVRTGDYVPIESHTDALLRDLESRQSIVYSKLPGTLLNEVSK